MEEVNGRSLSVRKIVYLSCLKEPGEHISKNGMKYVTTSRHFAPTLKVYYGHMNLLRRERTLKKAGFPTSIISICAMLRTRMMKRVVSDPSKMSISVLKNWQEPKWHQRTMSMLYGPFCKRKTATHLSLYTKLRKFPAAQICSIGVSRQNVVI